MNGWARGYSIWPALVVLGGFLLAPAGQTLAAAEPEPPANSWPMYGGTPQRNMVNPRDKNVAVSWSIEEGQEKNIKWSAAIGTRGYGSPVVAGGKVYVSTNNGQPRDPALKGNKAVLMCFREADGQFLWQIVHDMASRDVVREAEQDGLCSTPTVDGNRLYYVTPGAEVVCADTDGKTVWRLDMMKQLKVFPCYVSNCAPLVVGDMVYVVTGNGRDADNNLPSPEAPSFVALDKKSGQVVWQDHSPGDKILEGQWSNPVYAEVNGQGQVIFPGGDGWLYGLEAKTGKHLWKFDCNPKASEFKQSGQGTRNYIVATPVVYDNKVYVGVGQNPDAGGGPGNLWCVDITKTGDLSPVNDNFDPQAAVNKNSGLVWHYGGPAPKGGDRDYLFGRTVSTCAIQDGLLYAAEVEGFLDCFDAKTGQRYWSEDLKTAVWGSPYAVDGKVYLGNDDGDMTIFAQGKEVKAVGKVEMGESLKSTPVTVNGVLYV
ncbi:MAG: PQQ-binding-like beta-propeller repeat protein, partial [Planctomycetes bacterium]|nr:PQQ-binding-like beta-propeller repeat protein [Planctomycetota bacterium]